MEERVLLIGGGGREHAIARALADERLFAYSSNRNPGIAALADGTRTGLETDLESVVEYATSVDATLAVIGPESPLAAGVVDALADAGIFAFGPFAEQAKLEADKAYQRQFMEDAGIEARPAFETFDSKAEAIEYVESVDKDLAVKPRGLTGGKGVRVTGDQVSHQEAIDYIERSEYEEWVIEDRLVGEEVTIQALVSNGELHPTPAVKDHKRAYEGGVGPNTGGMGSYSARIPTLPFMTEEEYRDAVEILNATVAALDDYRGVLYGQFMLTEDGPKVVEYNVRFGDPEAMNTLQALETDFIEVLRAARNGSAPPELSFKPEATVCKYAVPAGYPRDPKAGSKVDIDVTDIPGADLYYASVDDRDDGLYTTTSRSFAVLGRGKSIEAAESRADLALTDIGDGFRVRSDIGTPQLIETRIDRMNALRKV